MIRTHTHKDAIERIGAIVEFHVLLAGLLSEKCD
jgi:hypothetical protein